MLQLLPYWDWTVYYSSGCLVENPYYEGEAEPPSLLEEDCNVSLSVQPKGFLKR